MTAATSITVRIPLTFRRRGGRKLVVTPDGGVPGTSPARTRADPALVKALARAHRWKRLLDQGRCGSLAELAALLHLGPASQTWRTGQCASPTLSLLSVSSLAC